MTFIRFLWLFSISSSAFATGGFEKSTLWSPRAAQHGGAYASSVRGSEALLFNPASLRGETKKEISYGVAISSGTMEAPIVQTDVEEKSFLGPLMPMGLTYSHSLNEKDTIGIGVYAIGGLAAGFDEVNLSVLGPEFNSFKPDVYGRLNVLELGLGYSRELSPNFSVGGTLRNIIANGGFAQVQVSEARGLGGLGIPDGTVLAASKAEFEDIRGASLGAFTLGFNYLTTDKDFGASVVYRSQVNIALEGEGKGKVVYSNTGALATGATAGQVYNLAGDSTTITSSLPEAWTLSFFKKIGAANKFHFEYTWAEYSHNKKLGMNGSLTNPVDNTTTSIPDVTLKWSDMHEFKLGWTNHSFEDWIIGGGYSLTLPVTNRNAAGPTFAVPANYHNFFFGLGKKFEKFRIDGAYEEYFSSGNGKTDGSANGNQASPPVSGHFKSRSYSFFGSFTYFL